MSVNPCQCFYFVSEMLGCCSLYFHQKIPVSYIKLSNSGLQKASKIILIPYFLSTADVSNKFAKFQCFANNMFFPSENTN